MSTYSSWAKSITCGVLAATTYAACSASEAFAALDKSGFAQVEDSRDLVKCMRRFAGQAYTMDNAQLQPDCDFVPNPSTSTDVMKFFSASNPSVESLLIAFTGTRFPDTGDVARDLQSQVAVYHQNPLRGSLPALGHIGAGWDARWNGQAKIANLAGILDSYISDAQSSGRTLKVFVVGHSLGAVVATVAGYDIAQYLRGKGLPQGVNVYSFNSPRMGSGGARDTYQDALFASVCPAAGNDLCLTLREFTRSHDAVQSVPGFMEHPVWQMEPLDMTVGPGSHVGQALGYCTQFNAPHLALPWPWTVLANHDLGAWDSQLDAIPEEQISCMFANHW